MFKKLNDFIRGADTHVRLSATGWKILHDKQLANALADTIGEQNRLWLENKPMVATDPHTGEKIDITSAMTPVKPE